MIEIICDKCGERIKDLPKETKANFSGKHICKNCIRGAIREYAMKVADAPLGYASDEFLAYIYEKLEEAIYAVEHITPPLNPYAHLCPMCGKRTKLISASSVTRERYCDRCNMVYDRHNKKIRVMAAEG